MTRRLDLIALTLITSILSYDASGLEQDLSTSKGSTIVSTDAHSGELEPFSEAEKAWLRHGHSVHYVYDPEWKPFEWADDLDEHTGIIHDVLRLIEKRSGIVFVQEASHSWDEAIRKVENAQVPMFSAIGVTEARKQYLSFSKRPLFSTPYVLVSRVDEDYLDGFLDTTGKRVATITTSTIETLLKEQRPEVSFTTVASIKDGFDALNDEKIDVFVVNAASARYYINILDYDDLKIAYKTMLTLDLRIALRKEMPPEVLSIIDKTMHTITKHEIDDIFDRWTLTPVMTKTDWLLMGKVIAVLILALLFMLWHNRKLKKMVALQTSRLHEQQTRLEELLVTFDKNIIASRTDTQGNITYVSSAFCTASGYTEEELLGQNHRIMRDPDTPLKTYNELWETILSGHQWRGELRNLTKEGDGYVTETVISPEYTPDGRLHGYSAIRQDITDKKRIERLSITDGLTNIYNRRHFDALLPRLVDSLAKEDAYIALMILDVDDFKLYNDTYGHQQGDKVLIKVASTLSASLHRYDDHCFRLGGEEFGAIFRSKGPSNAMQFGTMIKERIAALRFTDDDDTDKGFITVSIGLVCKKAREVDDIEHFYKEVDDLLYKAKKHGKDTIIDQGEALR